MEPKQRKSEHRSPTRLEPQARLFAGQEEETKSKATNQPQDALSVSTILLGYEFQFALSQQSA